MLVSTGELSLSCARLLDGWVTTLWLSCLLSVSQHGHQTHFVDHNDSEIHTQNVENMWMRAKRKIKRQFGTSRKLFPSYLHEFAFRNVCRGCDIFLHFMVCVAESCVCIHTENHTQQEHHNPETSLTPQWWSQAPRNIYKPGYTWYITGPW